MILTMENNSSETMLPHAALQARARERPAAEALVFPHQDTRLDYGEWWRRSRALASGLIELGIRPGDHVALLSENRWEWPVAQMGIAAAGAVMVPLNTHYRLEDLRYALDFSDVRAILLSPAFRTSRYLEMVESLRPEMPVLEWVMPFEGAGGDPSSFATSTFNALIERGEGVSVPLPEVDPWSMGGLQFTSGTTGFPKGAMLTHAGMMANARGTVARLALSDADRWSSIIPLFHCAGCIMTILSTVQAGAAYVGVPNFTPVGMFEVIERERCTAISGVPTSFLVMLEHGDRERYDLSTLRTGTCGGADADPAVLARCVEAYPIPELVQVFGQTEASTLVTCASVDDPKRLETSGTALEGFEVRITDPLSRLPLGVGEVGQVEARGMMTMLGYYKSPEATAEVLDADGWLRTGDLGRLDAEGRLIMAGGRLRDMIIRGGENIYPVEIENHLREHPAISEIAVFGRPDRYYGEIVAAAVRLSEPVASADLIRFARQRIASFKAPAKYFLIEEFPMTASGKIRKHELRALAGAGALVELN